MTQRELAAVLGVSTKSVARWKGGQCPSGFPLANGIRTAGSGKVWVSRRELQQLQEFASGSGYLGKRRQDQGKQRPRSMAEIAAAVGVTAQRVACWVKARFPPVGFPVTDIKKCPGGVMLSDKEVAAIAEWYRNGPQAVDAGGRAAEPALIQDETSADIRRRALERLAAI